MLEERASALVFDEGYMEYKDQIRESVAKCADRLVATTGEEMVRTNASMNRLMVVQGILLVVLLLCIVAEVIFITTQIRMPLARMVEFMRRQEPLKPTGAEELQFVTKTYNEFLEKTQTAQRQLSYEASHDPLTGLFNRSGYEAFMDNADQDHIALLIIDIDQFKAINDTYGHDVGDRILKRVAEILTHSFRSVDAICRVGGDEFVVVMTRANSSMHQLVINKIARANSLLQDPQDGLPKTSLSVGVAFSDRENPQGDIFKDADTALYHVKETGRCGCYIYGTREE